MRKLSTMAALLLALPLTVPAPAGATPYGREDNALGTLRWLPRNAIEKPTAANRFRLAVVYDSSIDATGAKIALKAKGAFGLKFFTLSQADLKMKAHSASVGDLKTLTGQPGLPAQADETFAGVTGDMRDGACAKVGTAGFSAAYSTTRSFLHEGTEPYAAASGTGFCEQVTASTEVRDPDGNLTGFQTTVKTHVPGFWIDVEWPTRPTPVLGMTRLLAEVWYGAAYDSAGDPGPFPNGVDTTGASTSVGSPGDYNLTYSFSASPGAIGDPCDGLPDEPGVGALAGSWMDVKVQVPEGALKVTFKLFPKGDWDLMVIAPGGDETAKANSGWWAAYEEVITIPGNQGLEELIPGEYTMRGCNYSGEQTVAGGVIIE